MKKILFALLMLCAGSAMAQYGPADDLSYRAPREPKLPLTAGQHLKLSGELQYWAIGSSFAAVGVYYFGIMNAALQYPDNPERMLDYFKTYKHASFALAATAVTLQLVSINHKIQAGKKMHKSELSAYATPTGAGLVLRF